MPVCVNGRQRFAPDVREPQGDDDRQTIGESGLPRREEPGDGRRHRSLIAHAIARIIARRGSRRVLTWAATRLNNPGAKRGPRRSATERPFSHPGRRHHRRRIALEGARVARRRCASGAAGNDVDAVLAQLRPQTLAEDGVERLAGRVAGDPRRAPWNPASEDISTTAPRRRSTIAGSSVRSTVTGPRTLTRTSFSRSAGATSRKRPTETKRRVVDHDADVEVRRGTCEDLRPPRRRPSPAPSNASPHRNGLGAPCREVKLAVAPAGRRAAHPCPARPGTARTQPRCPRTRQQPLPIVRSAQRIRSPAPRASLFPRPASLYTGERYGYPRLAFRQGTRTALPRTQATRSPRARRRTRGVRIHRAATGNGGDAGTACDHPRRPRTSRLRPDDNATRRRSPRYSWTARS